MFALAAMSLFNTRDEAANQLIEFAQKNKVSILIPPPMFTNTSFRVLFQNKNEEESATTTSGNPVPYLDAQLTVGQKGTTLFQDWYLFDEMAHFHRERIPERVVHAKGAGAFGYFEVTHDITAFTAAKVFSEIGKRTPIAVRFSMVAGEMGYPDTVRDPRGFAVKFYTEDGIWDLVGNNTPLFFVRDSILFPSFIHALKRNPVTHLRDPDMFWDFISGRPESTHQIMILFSDRGVPDGYRRMHGYGSDTFAFVNAYGRFVYCKFHYLTDQGIKNLTSDEADTIAGRDPDYAIRDLYNAIAGGNFPSWTLYVQIMTQEQAAASSYNPFDVTKVWYHAEYPLIPVGRLVLNRNPTNYFAEVEQVAFDPAHLIPGIEPSPDRMLQGRLFAYGDTHRYRLGANVNQIPVNSPFRMRTYTRDGKSTLDSQGGAPNYHPNSFGGPKSDRRAKALAPILAVSGNASKYDNGDEDNFTQARALYTRVLDAEARARLIDNIVQNLKYASDFIRERAIRNFVQVDRDFGRRIREGIESTLTLESSQLHAVL